MLKRLWETNKQVYTTFPSIEFRLIFKNGRVSHFYQNNLKKDDFFSNKLLQV